MVYSFYKMKASLLLVFSVMLVSVSGELCGCSNYKEITVCEQYHACKWVESKKTCQAKTCSDLNQNTCSFITTPDDVTLYCYWNGTACSQYQTCTQLQFSTAPTKELCSQYGCGYTSGKSCAAGDCSQFTKPSVCNQSSVFTNGQSQFCYYNTQLSQCQLFSSEVSCSQRTGYYQCVAEAGDTTCAWLGNTLTCVEGGCESATSATSDSCSDTYVSNGFCYFTKKECVLMPFNAPCSTYAYEHVCTVANTAYCAWDSQAKQCKPLTCSNVTCSGTTVSAHPSGSKSNYIFCQQQNNLCTQVNSNAIQVEECNDQTNNYYTWNGSSCQQCQYALLLSFIALIFAIMI